LKPDFPGSLREMTVLKHIIRRAVAWEYLTRNPARQTLVSSMSSLPSSAR
jgi:hypothetical protein